MPLKKKKGGAGKRKGGAAKGKAKGKRAAAAAAEKEEMLRKCRSFLRAYQQCCSATGNVASARICRDIRAAIENEKALVKFILEPSQATRPPGPAKPLAVAAKAVSAEGDSPLQAPAPAQTPSILLQPLISAWAEVRYNYVRSLLIWQVELLDDSVVQLALFMESSLCSQLQVLELIDNKLSPWSIVRLARALRVAKLTALRLDYNHLPLPALTSLCEALQSNLQLHTLSLSYCHIDPNCGEALGCLVALSQIRELSLRGNTLECEGATELIRPLVAMCESSEAQGPPPLARLDLRDNGMDGCGGGGGKTFVPVLCMRVFRRWILSSPFLEELNLDDNQIGDGGAREVMLAMQGRKEVGLPNVKMILTPRVSSEIFTAIVDLSVSHKKGGKKKGKKSRKKKR